MLRIEVMNYHHMCRVSFGMSETLHDLLLERSDNKPKHGLRENYEDTPNHYFQTRDVKHMSINRFGRQKTKFPAYNNTALAI